MHTEGQINPSLKFKFISNDNIANNLVQRSIYGKKSVNNWAFRAITNILPKRLVKSLLNKNRLYWKKISF